MILDTIKADHSTKYEIFLRYMLGLSYATTEDDLRSSFQAGERLPPDANTIDDVYQRSCFRVYISEACDITTQDTVESVFANNDLLTMDECEAKIIDKKTARGDI